MKLNKVSFLVLCSAVVLINQKVLSQSSGLIRYEERTDVHKLLPPEMAGMKKDIPRYSTTIFRLYFNSTESLYKGFEDDQPVATAGPGGAGAGGPGGPGGGGRSGGGGRQGGGGSPGGSPPSGGGSGGPRGGLQGLSGSNVENQIYTNSHKVVAQMVSLRKYYFMSDSIKMPQWKFGSEKKKIRGYECSVASYTDLSNPEKPQVITVWFTPEIRAFIGPERFNTLPGGVLEVDINDGEHSWVAKKVELRNLKDSEKIEAPVARNNSIWTSYERYKKAQEEQMNQQSSVGGQ